MASGFATAGTGGLDAAMTLDPRHLRILLAVVRSGSFSAAAEALGMSQPSVSVTIAQLEDKLGHAVLTRGRKGGQLTDEGRILLRHAEAMEAVLAEAAREISARAQGIAGPVVIGGTPGALMAIAPAALARLQARVGPVDVSLIEMADDALTEALRRRSIAMALCPARMGALEPDLEEIPLISEPFVLVSGPGSLPPGGLGIPDAATRSWVFPLQPGETRRQLEAVFIGAGVPAPRDVIRCDNLSVQKEILRHGGAIALLPRSVVAPELERGTLMSAPLHGGPPPRRLVALKLRSVALSPVAGQFLSQAFEAQEL